MLRLRRMVTFALATLLIGYLAIVGALFVFQRKLIFPAPQGDRAPMQGLVKGDGFFAMHYPGTPTVVHLHGNAEALWHSEWLARRYAEKGIGFYAIEYPGYGLAAATPVSEEAICATVEKAIAALDVPKDQIVLQGQSLGSGVAVEMAKRGHGTRLMLIAPYTSIADVAAEAFPILPGRWLVRDRFDSAAKAKDLKLPVLLIHGSEDEVIPTHMGRTLATLFPNATLKIVDGAHHNDLIDRPEVLDALTAFSRAR